MASMDFPIQTVCLLIFCLGLAAGVSNSNDTNTKGQETVACNLTPSPSICEAGSRMYRLLSYDVQPADIMFECKAACNESYTKDSDLSSCKSGCSSQVDVVTARQNQVAQYGSQGDAFMNQVQMQQMLSHWMFEMIAGFDMFNDWYDDTNYDSPSKSDYSTYVVVEQNNNQIRISSYHVAEPEVYASTQDYSIPLKDGQINPYTDSDDEDFEPCVSMTGYSRWVLCMLLMISAMFLVWLTCSTVSTSPKHKVKNTDERTQMPEKTDEKLALKMMMSYPPAYPAPVHSYKFQEDEKMLLA